MSACPPAGTSVVVVAKSPEIGVFVARGVSVATGTVFSGVPEGVRVVVGPAVPRVPVDVGATVAGVIGVTEVIGVGETTTVAVRVFVAAKVAVGDRGVGLGPTGVEVGCPLPRRRHRRHRGNRRR